jgi:hypothetical protein
MEAGGRYHEEANRPKAVFDEIRRMLEQDKQRLVILAPLKCERWLRDPGDARRLTEQVIGKYQPLLDYIRSDSVRARVACVLTPVQTIGSVVFNRIDKDSAGGPVFKFTTRGVPAVYAPVDTEQPLRYALKFILGKYRSGQRGLLPGLIQELMGTDAALVAAMEEFTASDPARSGAVLLQDHPFLHPGR